MKGRLGATSRMVVGRQAVRPSVVILTDRHLYPRREGSQARIVELIRGLREAGYAVVLVGRRISWHRMPRLPGFRSTLRTRLLVDEFISVDGAAFTGGAPHEVQLEPYVRALRDAVARFAPVAVIAEYLWMAPCLEAVPDSALRIVDTLDVMHGRSAIYRGQPQGAWVECTREEEAALLGHADVILAIQPHERRAFAQMLPAKTVLCVPHGLPIRPRLARAMDEQAPAIVFIGSRIQGNVVGLETFLEEAWPVIRARFPSALLHVYGDVVTRLERKDPGVRRHGYVSDLDEAYRIATVVINPVTLGTGLKIKTVEALAHGRAVVTTSVGADGLEDATPHALVVENDMRRFGGSVADLLGDPVQREALERTAHAYAAAHLGRSFVLRELRELLDHYGRTGAIAQDTPPSSGARCPAGTSGRGEQP
jgi:glycosyltransferase involved in cell wall biosynthesis